MNTITRGIRNAFRNQIRTLSIVLILSLSIGLALSMLLAHKAVDQKIQSVKASVGNTITISPAGVRGFEGGGNPLTTSQLNKIKSIAHVSSVTASLNDRLTSSNTDLKSAVNLGNLGQRFAQQQGSDFGGRSFSTANFTPPVTVLGTNDPTDLASTQGGGTFTLKSGQVFSSGSSDSVAVIGTALADKNNLKVGSTFKAYGKTVKVTGIFNSGNDFSNGLLIMPLKTVQVLSGQKGDVTNATVTVDSVENLSSTTQAIKTSLGSSADVTSSEDQEQNVVAPLENVKSISVYSLIGAVVAGAVIILLTMIMIVRERRREIGVLKAIGASNFKVISQFMSEAVTFTILAAVIGIIIGVAASNPITNTLVKNNSTSSVATSTPGGPIAITNGAPATNNTQAGGGQLNFRFGNGGVRQNLTNIKTSVGLSIIAYGLAAALAIAIVGSSIAAWFIAKIRPAEVMRAE